ncbi:MAG: RidA family protein [Prolixibacteraceae bacterium]|nr:RidA family protein [Prolixibacteraceae bacterium]
MIKNRLKKLGIVLPDPPTPGGNYTSVNIRGRQAFVAIQFPILNGKFYYQGTLGRELNSDDGYKAMQLCALNLLAQINKYIRYESLVGINHIDAYYRSTADWDNAPHVADGASDLIAEILGEKGTHSRALIGVASLPRNFSAGITASLTLQ